jgi:hypothetical protein
MIKPWVVMASAILLTWAPVCLSVQPPRAPGENAQLVRWALGLGGGQGEPEPAAIPAEAAAIRRQPGGGAELKAKTSSTRVWIRRFADGSHAVAAFNQGERAAQVDVIWKELGVAGQPEVRDVLNEKDLGRVHGGFAVKLTGGGAALYRVMPALKAR